MKNRLIILIFLLFCSCQKHPNSKQVEGVQINYLPKEMFSDSIYIIESRDFVVSKKGLIDSLDQRIANEEKFPNLSFLPYMKQVPLACVMNKDTAQVTIYYLSIGTGVLETFISRIEKNRIYLDHKPNDTVKQENNGSHRKSVIKIKIPVRSKTKYLIFSDLVG